MNSEVVMLVVSLLYGIPSLVLYVAILVQLVRPKYEKRFNNPFFKLCFLLGVVDCVGYLDFYIFLTLPTYSIFSSFYGSSFFTPSAFTTGIYFMSYFSGYLQLFGNCFLTFNRFTSIVFPFRHTKIWRKLFPISIVATVIFALAPCWFLATTKTFYMPLYENSPDSGYALAYDAPKYPNFKNGFNMFLSNFIACGFCLMMNIVVVTFLVIHGSRIAGVVPRNRKAELNMFFMALIIFILQGIYGLHQVLTYISARAGNDTFITVLYTLLPWISDLKFLSPAWVLFVVSTSIRETVMNVLPRWLRPNRTVAGGSVITATSVQQLNANQSRVFVKR
uniref:Serpentine receptor class gamma n=1 Tax=Steinernema glaseri TaxID=37863 RepID=A0A1I7YU49_9BILA